MENVVAGREWQCIYCGRFMDDRKAVRKVVEHGYECDACVACCTILTLYRGKKVRSKQDHVVKMFNVKPSPSDRVRYYVDREGRESLKATVAWREEQQE